MLTAKYFATLVQWCFRTNFSFIKIASHSQSTEVNISVTVVGITTSVAISSKRIGFWWSGKWKKPHSYLLYRRPALSPPAEEFVVLPWTNLFTAMGFYPAACCTVRLVQTNEADSGVLLQRLPAFPRRSLNTLDSPIIRIRC